MHTLYPRLIVNIMQILDTKSLLRFKQVNKLVLYTFNKYIYLLNIDLTPFKQIIDDNILCQFKGVHKINLEGCKKITDNGLEYFKV